MTTIRRFELKCVSLLLPVFVLSTYATAQNKDAYACTKDSSPQMCTDRNTCSSTSCSVDVRRTANAASGTPNIPNAKGNSLFCIKAGTKVEWKSTGKDIGFVVDFRPHTPFDHDGAIIGGSDRTVTTV